MSKKGLFFDMVTGVQSMILLVVIMVLFGIAFMLLSSDSTLHENKYSSPEDLRLINFLKTPIIIDNQETTLGDFIISANYDLEKRRILRSEIRKIISPYLKTGIENRIKIIFPDNDIWNVGEISSTRDTRKIISEPYITNKELTEDEILQIASIGLPTSNLKQINITLFKDPNEITTVIGTEGTDLNYQTFKIKTGGVPLSELVDTAPVGEIIEDYNGSKWVKVGTKKGPFLEGEDQLWMSEGYFCNTKIINGNVVSQTGQVVCVEYPNFPLEFDFTSHPYNMDTITSGGLCDVGCCKRSNWHLVDAQAGTVSFHPFNIDPELANISYKNGFSFRPIEIPSVYNCAAYNVYPALLKHIKKFGDEFKVKTTQLKNQKELNKFIKIYLDDVDSTLRKELLWGGRQIITPDNKNWIYLGENNNYAMWLDNSNNLCNEIIWKKDNQGLLNIGSCDGKPFDEFVNNNKDKTITFTQFKELYYHE